MFTSRHSSLFAQDRSLVVAALWLTFACSEAQSRNEAPAPTLTAPVVPVAPPGTPAPPTCGTDIVPRDHHYGVYLNGHKVGWMHSVERFDNGAFVSESEVHASVGGLGRVSEIELREMRRYDLRSKALLALSFSQSAQTGAVSVTGERRGKRFELVITAGGATTRQDVTVDETLNEARTLVQLACAGKGERTVSHFDASIQKNVTMTYEVVGREPHLLGGVTTDVLRVNTVYKELGVEESSLVDPSGLTLETKLGGFFVARIESAEVAKRLDYNQDLLVSAVVKTPKPLDDPEGAVALRVTFEGFAGKKPPASPRQRVSEKAGRVVLDLRREEAVRGTPLAAPHAIGAGKDLEATPFIQSDQPEIRAAARAAIGDATDTWTATERLARWVYSHVRDEYVPAYSNALEALRSGRGDCTEHAVLFVALARSLGIPAQVAVGIAYWPPGSGFGWHAWAEVEIGGRTVTVDPTWNQPIADATHIKLAAGDPAEQARIVMLLGALKITALEIL